MSSVLIVGATRGLGANLTKQYSEKGKTVFATTRSKEAPNPDDFSSTIKWVTDVDLMKSNVGEHLASSLKGAGQLDTVIINAGHFTKEDLFDEGPNWEAEVRMYTTSSVAPVFIVHGLLHAGLLQKGTKVVLVSSEAGSITLRHEKEGGANYGHHASKAALNMVGKLLSLDLKEKGIIISLVHPGFMRTEMTAGVGYDKFWDAGGAVTPQEGARTLIEWAESLDISKSGQYWAPRGPKDIGTAEPVLGANLPTPLQLPW